MKKNTFLFLLAGILLSCGPDWSNPDETLTLIPKIKEWIVNDPDRLTFSMLGTDSTQLNFSEQYSDFGSGGSASKGGFLSSYHVISYETYNQSFKANDSLSVFQINMEPSTNTGSGNFIQISLYGSRWKYDVSYEKMYFVSVDTDDTHNTKWSHDKIFSTVELLDTIKIQNVVCDSVMHFTMKDFVEDFSNETVTEVYYAKHIGLVKFVKHSGIEFERVW